MGTETGVRDWVQAAIGEERIPFIIDSFRPWMLQGKMTVAYQSGNVFLVGDAAHSFPPSAGIGLNTGFADAYNLAYKIAAVYHGWATPAIPDTYFRERRPIAEVNSHQRVQNGQRL